MDFFVDLQVLHSFVKGLEVAVLVGVGRASGVVADTMFFQLNEYFIELGPMPPSGRRT